MTESPPKDPNEVSERANEIGVMPSQFMRKLRPEYYSDTVSHVAILLSESEFGYHLETLTNRNQHQDFEIFCRKLCEKTICPYLRPATGPEGGGDGKVDTETYPVSDDISGLTFVGTMKTSEERWAFAFSTRKDWSKKVRQDVQSIVETGRGYDRIIFVTSRYTRDADRFRIEDELKSNHGVPVTIHDKAWLIEKVIDENRKELAYEFLDAGRLSESTPELGPDDYGRSQHLRELEEALSDPHRFDGMEAQRATEALVAAKLSRNLERPRSDTDGMFARAIRLAENDGTERQLVLAEYEQIWTAFWWFDDFDFLLSGFDEFEARVIDSPHAQNLELLCNLIQLLINSVLHRHLSPKECQLSERMDRAMSALKTMQEEIERPNNALQAKVSYLFLSLNKKLLAGERDQLSKVWQSFEEVVDRARGLAEFPMDHLVRLLESMGQAAGDDREYTQLVEKVADHMAERQGDSAAGLILLRRAKQLDFEQNFEMIRLLGRASSNLAKLEHAEAFVECLQLLALSYRSAGLLWAARASCILSIGSLVAQDQDDPLPPIAIIPTLKLWGWISLEIGHLPDFMLAVQLFGGLSEALPLVEESKKRTDDDILHLDAALGSALLNCANSPDELARLPDMLSAIGLHSSALALAYFLGYEEDMREAGEIPVSETPKRLQDFIASLASQPAGTDSVDRFFLNLTASDVRSTSILGMIVRVAHGSSTQSVLLADSILGIIDAFFATALDLRLAPHTEQFSIEIEEQDSAIPSFSVDLDEMSGVVVWPESWNPSSFEHYGDTMQFLVSLVGQLMAATCFAKDFKATLQGLFEDETVSERVSSIAHIGNSYHRFVGRSLSRVSDWEHLVRRSYPPKVNRPEIKKIKPEKSVDEDGEKTTRSASRPDFPKVNDHRDVKVYSIINAHLWNRARWQGTAYIGYENPPEPHPPGMALMFGDEEAARKIFAQWRDRFGRADEDSEIRVAIIRNTDTDNPHHYRVSVSPRLPDATAGDEGRLFQFSTRHNVMMPNDSRNLSRFLEDYNRLGAYFLFPALSSDSEMPELLTDLAILKRGLIVKDADTLDESDIEYRLFGERNDEPEVDQ